MVAAVILAVVVVTDMPSVTMRLVVPLVPARRETALLRRRGLVDMEVRPVVVAVVSALAVLRLMPVVSTTLPLARCLVVAARRRRRRWLAQSCSPSRPCPVSSSTQRHARASRRCDDDMVAAALRSVSCLHSLLLLVLFYLLLLL